MLLIPKQSPTSLNQNSMTSWKILFIIGTSYNLRNLINIQFWGKTSQFYFVVYGRIIKSSILHFIPNLIPSPLSLQSPHVVGWWVTRPVAVRESARVSYPSCFCIILWLPFFPLYIDPHSSNDSPVHASILFERTFKNIYLYRTMYTWKILRLMVVLMYCNAIIFVYLPHS